MMDSMRYGSVCSGIEAASVAWEPLGFSPAWFSEIEPFPSAVLAHHWPNVANLGDMTAIAGMVKSGDVDAPSILVGGTPCQAFSVAGARKGLADERGVLTIKYVELADAIDDKRQQKGQGESIIVWENVPGVLSSKDNAFGAFLGLLSGEECELVPPGKKWSNAGYVSGPKRAIAWRVLDAQYFGVAQRRRRVFVVASARKDFDPAKVLFEREGVRRDIAPSREAEKEIAGPVGCSSSFHAAEKWRGFNFEQFSCGGELIPTLTATEFKGKTLIYKGTIVRRITPSEGELLQGFPYDHTAVPFKSGVAADSHRYKAIGNSMAVPCMKWIGQRIKEHLSTLTQKGLTNDYLV
ncbi:DNA cytosine methyltransferase [Plesiomonas shigelloides]|uniref:DNA cytosine methyltransferase n=1 Tax=Plesiomonas shigelloides TaxID=703 RepID=UPI002E331108|nr:DNA cytosine methyltransferase [Plesiomonas shigelloides]